VLSPPPPSWSAGDGRSDRSGHRHREGHRQRGRPARPWPGVDHLVQAGAPDPVPAPAGDLVGELTELARLRESGALTDAEFEAAKAALLAR
jgi:hypothetical protein